MPLAIQIKLARLVGPPGGRAGGAARENSLKRYETLATEARSHLKEGRRTLGHRSRETPALRGGIGTGAN